MASKTRRLLASFFLDSKQAFNCLVITYLLSHQAKAKMKAKYFLLPVRLVLELTLVQYTKAGRQAKC